MVVTGFFVLCVCLSEDNVTQATLALHRHVLPCWTRDDSRSENLPLSFGPTTTLKQV